MHSVPVSITYNDLLAKAAAERHQLLMDAKEEYDRRRHKFHTLAIEGEAEAFLAHTANSVADLIRERGAKALLTVLDDETTFQLWKELTSGEYYGR